jgi:uncharacterized protein YndB with AHSA1/START domain
MSEIVEEINRVHREVGKSGPPTVLLRRSYDAAIADVWQACTDPDRLRRWFLPVSGDLRVGGHYQVEGNAGGEILACEAPGLLRISWIMGDGEPSEVRVRLSAIDAETTEFELEHGRCGDPEQWTRYGPGSVGVGWDLLLSSLRMHVAGGALGDPAVWATSPEYREQIAGTVQAWVAAHEAAGVDPEQARAGGRETLAFYLPPAP